MSLYKQIAFVLSVIVLSLLVGYAVSRAWSEPTEAPPEGNVPAPINVGEGYQVKAGALRLDGGLVLKDANENCWKYSASVIGDLVSERVDCETGGPMSLGSPCNENEQCLSGYCYRDEDGDGYHAVSGQKYCQATASLGEDCYDLNANVYPEQTSYFSVDRGDGSFDYDCNGSETQHNMYCSLITGCETQGICEDTTCATDAIHTINVVGIENYYPCGSYERKYRCHTPYYRDDCTITTVTYKYTVGTISLYCTSAIFHGFTGTAFVESTSPYDGCKCR